MTAAKSQLDLAGMVVIVGSYGSGKTEVAINLALDGNRRGLAVRVADLDLVNPYFRTREARRLLSAHGIDLILPADELLQADLPVLAPEVAGLIRRPGDLAILDAGGDKVGATVLAALADAFKGHPKAPRVLQVVNPFRPTTETVQQCLIMRTAIEEVSGLSVTGWIDNANLMDETTAAHILEGYAFMRNLSRESGLPIVCVTVGRELLPELDAAAFDCPVLAISRQLVPPWKKPSALP